MLFRSGASAKSPNGIAPADINPENYEINHSAGRSILGLKSNKEDDDNSESLHGNGKPAAGANSGKANPGRAVAEGSGKGEKGSLVQLPSGELSVFMMVRQRYKTLRELGQI